MVLACQHGLMKACFHGRPLGDPQTLPIPTPAPGPAGHARCMMYTMYEPAGSTQLSHVQRNVNLTNIVSDVQAPKVQEPPRTSAMLTPQRASARLLCRRLECRSRRPRCTVCAASRTTIRAPLWSASFARSGSTPSAWAPLSRSALSPLCPAI